MRRKLETPVAHLLCGKPGSGKTTLARQLEADGLVRFTLDEWMIRLYGHHMPREVFDARKDKCMDLILHLATRLARLNVSVVLDCGFWTRSSRLGALDRLLGTDAQTILHYFEVDDAELQDRLARRNSDLPPGTFEITPEMVATFSEQFEPPTDDEDHVIAG